MSLKSFPPFSKNYNSLIPQQNILKVIFSTHDTTSNALYNPTQNKDSSLSNTKELRPNNWNTKVYILSLSVKVTLYEWHKNKILCKYLPRGAGGNNFPPGTQY